MSKEKSVIVPSQPGMFTARFFHWDGVTSVSYAPMPAWRITDDEAEPVDVETRLDNSDSALYFVGPSGPVWLFLNDSEFHTESEAIAYAHRFLRKADSR